MAMIDYLGALILIAGIYSFTRGCWLGGGYLFAWLAPALIYICTAISIFER